MKKTSFRLHPTAVPTSDCISHPPASILPTAAAHSPESPRQHANAHARKAVQHQPQSPRYLGHTYARSPVKSESAKRTLVSLHSGSFFFSASPPNFPRAALTPGHGHPMLMVLPILIIQLGGALSRDRSRKRSTTTSFYWKSTPLSSSNRHLLILGQNPAKNIRLGLPLEVSGVANFPYSAYSSLHQLLHLRLAQCEITCFVFILSLFSNRLWPCQSSPSRRVVLNCNIRPGRSGRQTTAPFRLGYTCRNLPDRLDSRVCKGWHIRQTTNHDITSTRR